MELLQQIISSLDRKDVKNYKIYASRSYGKGGRKDFDLFDSLRRFGENVDEESLFARLYKNNDRNSFYQLKNRLSEDINLSIFIKEYKNNETIEALYITAMGYHYYTRNNFKLALHYYKRAEKKARHIEDYGLLDIIYSRLIKISQEVFSENPETYIRRRTENKELLLKMIELENVIQTVEYKVKMSHDLSATNIEKMLNLTIDDYLNDKELKDSPKLQISIYMMISRKLLQTNDFTGLLKYLVNTFKTFEAKKIFNKSTHSTKLEMITWIANALFHTKKFKKSLEYAELLKQEMEKYDKSLHDRYEFFYLNTLVINYSEINPEKAIEILLDLTNKDKVNKLSINGLYVFLNLGVLYHNKNDYKNSLKYLTRFYNYEGYKKMDDQWKLRINLAELMMRYELKDKETVAYRLKQVQKDFKNIISSGKLQWEKDFMEVLSRLSSVTKKVKDITEYAENVVDVLKKEKKEIVLFNYADWANDKLRMGR